MFAQFLIRNNYQYFYKLLFMKYKKDLLTLSCFLLTVVFFPTLLMAQVTIGTLDPASSNALLDLKETTLGTSTKGLLLPRVKLESTDSPSPMTSHEPGLCVYNTATTKTGTNDVTPGIYCNDGTKWVRVETPEFFYMPSILLPLDTSDPAYSAGTFTVNLYAQYAAQMSPTTKNAGAESLPLYSKNELNYFITYYDAAVFTNVNVDNNGVMTYQLVGSPVVSEKTYMNIIFQVKQ